MKISVKNILTMVSLFVILGFWYNMIGWIFNSLMLWNYEKPITITLWMFCNYYLLLLFIWPVYHKFNTGKFFPTEAELDLIRKLEK